MSWGARNLDRPDGDRSKLQLQGKSTLQQQTKIQKPL
jgi:hypothetical protein